jgi:DNA-binding NtrC family response regulator
MTLLESRLPILLVDDEEDVLFSATMALSGVIRNRILTESDPLKLLPLLEKEEMAAIILDLNMPGITGQELLSRITSEYPHIPVLIMTASATIDMAVACMKNGAFDYLVKPVDNAKLATSIQRALELHRLRGEVDSLKSRLLDGELRHQESFAPIITHSRNMRAVFSYLESISFTDRPVLITGETGVGKDLVARAIHDVSAREGKFVAINIAGLDDHVFTDTLFGHRRGAYTGADQAREGLAAEAANGTLLLEEIGDLSEASQIKLLRLIQTNEYYPLGSDVAKRSAARVIATTNRDMQQIISTGGFRRDLFFRLSTHSCRIPPLRERRNDIAILFEHFLTEAALKLNRKKPSYSEGLVRDLTAYSFPGNVRELQGMVYDAVAQHKSGDLSPALFVKSLCAGEEGNDFQQGATLPVAPKGMDDAISRFPTLQENEERLIEQAMARAGGNQRVAAALLGISRQALNNRLLRKRRKG